MKRRTFLGSLLAAPAAAALARTLPKIEHAAPPLDFDGSAYPLDSDATIHVGVDPAQQTAEGWDLGDYSGIGHPEQRTVSVQINGVTYYLLTGH